MLNVAVVTFTLFYIALMYGLPISKMSLMTDEALPSRHKVGNAQLMSLVSIAYNTSSSVQFYFRRV